MRLSANKYYILKYVKCDNCGMLIYDEGIKGKDANEGELFCSQWCVDWASAKKAGVAQPKIPLPQRGAL